MACVKAGSGREGAHEAIKEHAVAVALEMRAGRSSNDLLDRLAGDARVPLDRAALDALLATPLEFTGAARSQTKAIIDAVNTVTKRYPDAAKYRAGAIL